MRKKAFPIILLLICWIFNIFECLFSDEIEISLKNIITFKSVIFTFIITILFIYFDYEKNSSNCTVEIPQYALLRASGLSARARLQVVNISVF